ncbi:uncharacterized protein LOC143224201 [Tachypleus tridentatus]|uniref:uncharacterized protein LOC143224201 n=1 Tax=Tachypleus tridentatus TaxID=6853 RepID=UPI003FD48F7E
MYDWIFLLFLATLQVPQSCPLPINSSSISQPVSPDFAEVICKEGKRIISGTWLRHRSTVKDVLLPNPKSVVAKGGSCCSLCFSIVRKDSRVCVLTEALPSNSMPNSEINVTIEADWILQCIVERFPVPDVLGFKDNTTFDKKVYPYYNRSIEKIENCTVFVTLKAILSLTTETINNITYENYTCEATNKYGTVLTYLQLIDMDGVISNMTVRTTDEKTKPDQFNVTGFIVGMLPPLFISFYIILKLGNRSRYAEERAEEQGIREEPFFVSY